MCLVIKTTESSQVPPESDYDFWTHGVWNECVSSMAVEACIVKLPDVTVHLPKKKKEKEEKIVKTV